MKAKMPKLNSKDFKYEIDGKKVSESVFFKAIAADIKAVNKSKKKKKTI